MSITLLGEDTTFMKQLEINKQVIRFLTKIDISISMNWQIFDHL